jgi:hypothetical protein
MTTIHQNVSRFPGHVKAMAERARKNEATAEKALEKTKPVVKDRGRAVLLALK